mgnify:FL=1
MIIIFIIFPIAIILLFTWLITKKIIYGKILGIFYLIIIAFAILGSIINYLSTPKILKKNDYYGEYVIKRDFFKGKQSDWQYNHFRFEIKENDSIYFYFTENEKILKTIRGKITTVKPYSSERLIIKMDSSFHILETNPTIYREPFDFYLVFKSEKFNNVFFEKGQWKSLNK